MPQHQPGSMIDGAGTFSETSSRLISHPLSCRAGISSPNPWPPCQSVCFLGSLTWFPNLGLTLPGLVISVHFSLLWLTSLDVGSVWPASFLSRPTPVWLSPYSNESYCMGSCYPTFGLIPNKIPGDFQDVSLLVIEEINWGHNILGGKNNFLS